VKAVIRRPKNATGDAGRPRVEGDRENEILDATVDLLLSHGYERLTMDAVAKRARASKATLYRRWTSKQVLVVDAVSRAKSTPDFPDIDTGSLRGDLMATFCGSHQAAFNIDRGSLMLAAVMSALQPDPEFAAEFRTRFIAPKIETTRRMYERAAARGEIPPNLDLSILAPALGGILLHRKFVLGEPVDDEVVMRIIDTVIIPAATAGLAQANPA